MREADGLLLNYGGKSRIAHKLVQHFPKGPNCYVEPFFGGGGTFFSVPEQLYPVQVINDLNKSVVTFYRVLRDRTDDLLRVCSLTPFALDEQRACRDSSKDPEDELEVARRVWVRQRQNFGGRQHPSAGWRRGTEVQSCAAATAAKLPEFERFARRMLSVEINNTDALELVQTYSKPNVFIYADPPYYPETRTTNNDYEHEMSPEQHLRLSELLHAASDNGARVAISGYDCPFYNEQYGSWRRVEYQHYVSSTNFVSAEERTRTECMWVNYPVSLEIGPAWQPNLKATNSKEKALLRLINSRRGLK
jgi:DNA adenine methylase